jgi:hypothetical protein
MTVSRQKVLVQISCATRNCILQIHHSHCVTYQCLPTEHHNTGPHSSEDGDKPLVEDNFEFKELKSMGVNIDDEVEQDISLRTVQTTVQTPAYSPKGEEKLHSDAGPSSPKTSRSPTPTGPSDFIGNPSPVVDDGLKPDDGLQQLVEVDLDWNELKSMGDDIEIPGEVEDLYHNPPFESRKKKKSAQQQTPSATAGSLESTPSKRATDLNQETPRRSPRLNDDGLHGGVLFNVVRMIVTDTKGVDSRIDIPKVIVFSHKDTPQGQDVDELKRILQDTSESRSKVQFDLCKLLYS